jgi:hypothetical protein
MPGRGEPQQSRRGRSALAVHARNPAQKARPRTEAENKAEVHANPRFIERGSTQYWSQALDTLGIALGA